MWRLRGRVTHRYMSPLQLFLLNFAFILSAFYVMERHVPYLIWGVSAWLLPYILLATVFYRKGMRMHIGVDAKTDLIKVPVFFFRLIFYIYLPYILVYLSLLAWNESIFNDLWFVMFVMLFKGCVSGVYAGFSLAAVVQVHDREEQSKKMMMTKVWIKRHPLPAVAFPYLTVELLCFTCSPGSNR